MTYYLFVDGLEELEFFAECLEPVFGVDVKKGFVVKILRKRTEVTRH